MKKAALLTLTVLTLAAADGLCDSGATTGSRVTGPEASRHAHRASLIAKRKANPESAVARSAGTGEESKTSKFWKNEAERSGVSGWKLPAVDPAGFFRDQDRKYKERKSAAAN